MNFERELSALLNKHGIDANCEIPDYILAAYIHRHVLNIAATQREIKRHNSTSVDIHDSLINQGNPATR